MITCPFCISDRQKEEIPEPNSQWKAEIHYRIIERDESSLLAAGLGALVFPYLLYIPRRHITGFVDADTKEQESLIAMLDLCIRSGLFPSGELSLFEHGGHGAGTCSCVDHCHIHIVDGRFDLMRLMEETKPKSIPFPFCLERDSISISTPYLWAGRYRCESKRIEGTIHSADGHGPQYFRRILAAWIRSEEWDWRLYPRWDNIERLISSWHFERSFP